MRVSKRDVIVVGAGPAGLTVARYCAAYGLDVLVVERRRSIGTVVRCGEYLASDDEVLNMFPRAYELEHLHKCAKGCVQRTFDALTVYSPKGRKYLIPFNGIMIDRPVFERNLWREAELKGAEILLSTRAMAARGREVITSRGSMRGRVIVGADGPVSRIAASVGLPQPAHRYRAVTTFSRGSIPDRMELYFGQMAPGAYAWIFPKNGEANVGLGVWEKFGGNVSELLRRWLKGIGLTWGEFRGKLVPASGPVSPTQKGNVLVVGDAAGHVIPTSGGGMQTSMIGAREAAKAIREHLSSGVPLERYEVAWRRIMWEPLKRGLKIKILADNVLWSDALTALSMRMIGARGIGRGMRCQRLFRSTKMR